MYAHTLMLSFVMTVCVLPTILAGEGLVAHYPLDDGNGQVVRDLSPNRHTGKINGAAWATTDRINVLDFSSGAAWIDCGKGERLALKDQITVSLWMQAKKAAANKQEIILAGEWVDQWGITYYGTGAYFYINGGANYCRVPITTDNWHHLAGTFDGSEMRMYLNGHMQAKRTLPPGVAIKTSAPFIIGGTIHKNKKWYFPGLMSDVRVYNRALDADEIVSLEKTHRETLMPAVDKQRLKQETVFFEQHKQPIDLATSEKNLLFANNHVGIALCKSGSSVSLARIYGIEHNQDYLTPGFEKDAKNLWELTLRRDRGRDKNEQVLHLRNARNFSYSTALSPTGTTLHLDWTGIDLPDRKDALDVRASITLKADDPLSRWRISVRNRSKTWGLWQVRFPLLRLQPISGERRDNAFVYIKDRGRLVTDCFNAPNGFGHGLHADEPPPLGFGQSMPGSISMQFQSLYNEKTQQGLYLATNDSRSYAKHLRVIKSESDLHYMIGHDPDNMGYPGEDYAMSYDFIMGPFTGDWYNAAQIYRAWAIKQPWCAKGPLRTRADIPTWFKQAPAFLVAYVMSNPGELDAATERWLRLEKLAGMPLGGTIYGWKLYDTELTAYDQPDSPWRVRPERPYPCGNTHDGNYPKSPALANLAKACEKIRQAGGYPSPYVCLQILDQGRIRKSPYYEEGISSVVRDPEGKLTLYSGEPSWAMCASADWWEQRLEETCRLLVQKENMRGLYLDTMHGGGKACFAVDHGHSHGGGNHRWRGMHTLSARCRDAAKAIDPQVYTYGENPTEDMIDVIDGILYQRTLHPHLSAPIFAAVYQDYILRMGITTNFTDEEGFFIQAGALFVEGAQIGRVRLSSDIFSDTPMRKQQLDFFNRLCGYYRQAETRKFLSYGRLLRPLTFTAPNPMPVTDYAEGRAKSYLNGRIELPVLQAGVFLEDGELGVFVVNVSADPVNWQAAIDLAQYASLAPTLKQADIRQITFDGRISTVKRNVSNICPLSGVLPGRGAIMFRLSPAQ